jgi:hypothetical protein
VLAGLKFCDRLFTPPPHAPSIRLSLGLSNKVAMQPVNGVVQRHMVARKVKRCDVSSSSRIGARSCPNTAPKLKFKKQWVHKLPQQGNEGSGLAGTDAEPRSQSLLSEGDSLVRPRPQQVAEPKWLQQQESLPCSPWVVDPMRLELTLAWLVPPTGPCTSPPRVTIVAPTTLRVANQFVWSHWRTRDRCSNHGSGTF